MSTTTLSYTLTTLPYSGMVVTICRPVFITHSIAPSEKEIEIRVDVKPVKMALWANAISRLKDNLRGR